MVVFLDEFGYQKASVVVAAIVSIAPSVVASFKKLCTHERTRSCWPSLVSKWSGIFSFILSETSRDL